MEMHDRFFTVVTHPFGSLLSWVQNEKEYRFATYLGAKAVKIEKGEIIIKQGDMALSVHLLEQNSQLLLAPVSGDMNRTIHESASCRVLYSFRKKGQTIIEFESPNASFEYEY